jgi:hypothetical protein
MHNLPLPPLLIELINQRRWIQPSAEFFERIVPFCPEPMILLPSIEEIYFETAGIYEYAPLIADLIHIKLGSRSNIPLALPWLDIEQAYFIAVNRIPGDDIGIALDYRTSNIDPRMVASDWSDDSQGCVWREISPTFSQFVRLMEL